MTLWKLEWNAKYKFFRRMFVFSNQKDWNVIYRSHLSVESNSFMLGMFSEYELIGSVL